MNELITSLKRIVNSTTLLWALSIVVGSSLFAQSSPVSSVANLITPRTGHTATLLNSGTVLIVGGENQGAAIADSELYHPDRKTFEPAAQLHLARTYHSATKLTDGRVLVTGGRFGATSLDSTEIYDPVTASFSAGPFMTRPRYGHTATLLKDGRVLIVGGEDTGVAEIYDVASKQFAPVESLCIPRFFHAATLLSTGNVLIGGGVSSDHALLTRAETLDLSTMGFANVMNSMVVGRLRPTVNLLPDGKVQFIGGDASNTIEVFEPVEATFKGLVHLPPSPDLFAATISTPSRAALFKPAPTQNPLLAALFSEPIYQLLLDRSGHSLTEIPQLNIALVAGGVTGSSPNSQASNSAMIVNSFGASISTEKTDYSPGTFVPTTGKGWLPGETVAIVYDEEPEAHANSPILTVADATGNASTEEFTPLPADLGKNFTVTATGQSSGRMAQTSFSDAAQMTITLGSQETLWLDSNKCSADGPRAAWLSFIIKNTGASDATNVVVTFAGFTGTTGGLVQPSYFSAPSDLTRTFSKISAGAQEPVYFYVDYATVCSHSLGGGSPYTGYNANYTVTVNATGLSAVVRNGTVTTGDLLSASAAGEAQTTTVGPGFYVGQLLTQTVAYNFGNNTDLFFQPAGDAAFNSACIRLVGSEITGVTGTVPTSLIGLKDQLWFSTASVSGGGGLINLTFTWQINCVNTQQTLHPWAAAKSGQKYKYAGFLSSTVYPPSVSALTVSKTVSPASLLDNTGGPVTWTVTFTNAATVPVVLAKITDVLPTCMSINEATSSGSQVTAANSFSIPSVNATGTVSWLGFDLGKSSSSTYQVPANTSFSLIFKTNVSGCSFPGSYTNSVTGTVGTITTTPATATLPIGGVPGISLSKTASPTTYTAVGQTITYTYKITNTGNVTLAGPFSVTDDKLGTLTNCSVGSLAPGAATSACTATHNITQVEMTAGSLTNTATATTTYNSATVTSNQSQATVTANAADLQVTKTDGSATYTPGTDVAYTIGVANSGPSVNGGFTVTDTIPAGTTFVSASAGCANVSGTVTCASAGLALNASTSWTVTVHVSASQTGSLSNTAAIGTNNTPDPTPGNNSATDTDTQASSADLSITNTDGSATYTPGGNVTYTVVVSNAGPSAVTGATVTDPLPSGITTATWTAVAAGGATGFSASGSGAISDTVNMPVGSSITYTVTMTVPGGRTGALANVATVAVPSGTTDPTPGNNSATDTDTQASSADLSITNTDGSATYTPGGNVTYTVVVSNAGPSAVTGATVTDPLPSGITTATWTAVAAGGATGFSASGSGGISDTVNMPVGSSITYTVTTTVPAGRTGALANVATIAAPSGTTDPTQGNNSATDTDTQASSADLSVTNTDGSATYTPGGNVTYTVVVSNTGPSAVTGATVTDPLPSGITTATWTAVAAGGATGFSASGSGAISDTVNMPVGSSITYTVTTTVPAGRTGALANVATVAAPSGTTDPTPGNNSATDTDTQASSADLSITNTDGSATYTPGGNVTYTVVVSNAGPSAVTGATVTDPLPSGITTATWTAVPAGGATGFSASGSGAISDTVNMPVGSSITYTVTMTVPAGRTGALANVATVAVPSGTTDPTPGNNSATDTDTQASSADLSITNTDGSATYTPGNNVTYTVVVSNAGPSAVTGATVTDPLPSGITTASWTAVAAGGATGFSASGSGAISDTVNMPVGSSITYTVTMTVPAGRTGALTNVATVAAPSGTTDPTPANNSATDTDTQASSADLSITNTDGSATYTPGNNVTYTVVVSNTGPSAVTGATVTDPLPSGITTATWTAVAAGGATGFSASGSGAISDTVNMPVGSSITYTVMMTVPAGRTGALANVATVAAPSGTTDPTPGNNSATDTDTQASNADLSITNTDGSATYTPGNNVTYTVVVSNAGPSAVTGATVTDPLPSGITTATWTALAAGGATGFSASGSGAISDTVNMPAGSSIIYMVTIAVPAGRTGALTNVATVAAPSGTTDPTPGNNSATDTDAQVIPPAMADLSVMKTDGASTYTPGTDITYTIIVTNQGPSANTGFTVTDVLPVGTTFVSAPGCANAAGSVTCTSAGLLVSGAVSWTVTLHVDANRTGCLTNTAAITANNTADPVAGNDSSADTDNALGGTPQAAGLGLTLGYAAIAGNNTSRTATAYTAGSQLFRFDSTPATVRFSSSDVAHLFSGAVALSVQAKINNSGVLIGGAAGNDLILTGTVTDQFGQTYSGTLLTAEIVQFGYRELGSTDRFELRFVVTGGSMSSQFVGKDLGIVVTAESSTFNNSFGVSFASTGKFTMGSLPQYCAIN